MKEPPSRRMIPIAATRTRSSAPAMSKNATQPGVGGVSGVPQPSWHRAGRRGGAVSSVGQACLNRIGNRSTCASNGGVSASSQCGAQEVTVINQMTSRPELDVEMRAHRQLHLADPVRIIRAGKITPSPCCPRCPLDFAGKGAPGCRAAQSSNESLRFPTRRLSEGRLVFTREK
jgi:hypothetical protein